MKKKENRILQKTQCEAQLTDKHNDIIRKECIIRKITPWKRFSSGDFIGLG
jgi:hypothetical protein